MKYIFIHGPFSPILILFIAIKGLPECRLFHRFRPTTNESEGLNKSTYDQWLFLVPVKGGR